MEEDLDYKPKSPLTRFLLPALTVGVALSAGVVAGSLATWLLTRQAPEVVEVPRLPTQEELEAACAPLVEEAAQDLEEAQTKVDTLEARVQAKTAQVQELQAEMTSRASKGRMLAEERNALRAELERAQTELADLSVKLARAVEEKEALVVELRVTKQELVEKTEEARIARNDSLENKWRTFQGRALLAVCEKGRRKKIGNCREKVAEELNAEMARRYTHCIRSGQSVPSLHELEKNEQLPQFAEFLDQESKVTKDWYILLCDPTLPEATDLAEVEHLLKADAWGAELDVFQITDDEEPVEEPAARGGDLGLRLDDLPEVDDGIDLDSLDN
ncbi:MAG: hypothetical protein JXX28_18005 [Deltaproteobacteria bacterium]|nr:hypothetical protein [Deltaproteobacteria bacterium]